MTVSVCEVTLDKLLDPGSLHVTKASVCFPRAQQWAGVKQAG